MIAPDFRRGYLRLPLSVWLTVFCQAPLSRRQLQLVAVVIRESWGWQQKGGEVRLWTRPLAVRDFANATRLSTDHLGRDLLQLVAMGVIEEQNGRYRFVADTRQWITSTDVPPESRRTPLFPPASPAKIALVAPVVKTINTKKRNVYSSPVTELSTAGENSGRRLGPRSDVATSKTTMDRFINVVAASVGPLSDTEAQKLRDWVGEVGIATVWRVIEPTLRQDRYGARRILLERLAARGTPPK